MRHIILSFLLLFVVGVQAQNNFFTENALNDTFVSLEGTEISFSEILEANKGKTIFIDLWAGWCKDCIIGMPKVKKLQKKNKDVVFLFLSLDKTEDSWKKGVKALKIEGEHYFISSGWKGAFCSSLDLDWIPRYMIVNPEGEIVLCKAIKADDERISELLKN